jgi:hypothetical protein
LFVLATLILLYQTLKYLLKIYNYRYDKELNKNENT